jgi:hypothetical protein
LLQRLHQQPEPIGAWRRLPVLLWLLLLLWSAGKLLWRACKRWRAGIGGRRLRERRRASRISGRSRRRSGPRLRCDGPRQLRREEIPPLLQERREAIEAEAAAASAVRPGRR